MPILLIIGLFLVMFASIIPSPAEPVWFPQYIALFSFLCFFLVGRLWKFNKFLVLFLNYCLFSSIFVAKLNPRSVILTIQLILVSFGAYQISQFDKKYVKWIFNALFGLVLVHILWIVLQIFNLDPIFRSIKTSSLDNAVGFCGSWDTSGAFLAITSPLLSFFHPLFLGLSLIGVFASRSSFSFVSLLVSSLGYLFCVNKKAFKIALTSLCIGAFIFFAKVESVSLAQIKNRGLVWKTAISSAINEDISIRTNKETLVKVKGNMWVGYGIGRFLNLFPRYPETTDFNNSSVGYFAHAHNDYVEMFFDLGIVGVMLVLALLIDFIIRFIKTRKCKKVYVCFWAIMAYLLNASGYFISHIAVTGMLLTVFYGLFECLRGKNGIHTSVS